MRYPRDCVSRLVRAINKNDPDDPPESELASVNSQARDRYRPKPSRDQLRRLLDVAHAASLQPEEGRLPQFALAFISPQGPGKDYDAFSFESAKDFDPRSLAKLTPATNPNRTFLGVWPGLDAASLQVWGLIQSRRGPLSTEPVGGRAAFLWRDPFLIVRVVAPGVFFVYYAQRLLLAYSRGEAHWGVTAGRLQAVLRDRAAWDGDMAEGVSQIAARMVLLGRGGSLLITDPANSPATDSLDVSCRFDPPNTLLRDALKARRDLNHRKDTEPRVRAALDFVADLSQVDGAVHMTSDLVIHGFGAKIGLGASMSSGFLAEIANPTYKATKRRARDLVLSDLHGMRHRSAVLFCAQQPGQALAIVVSQDGDVTFFGRQPNGKVRSIGPFALGIGLAVT